MINDDRMPSIQYNTIQSGAHENPTHSVKKKEAKSVSFIGLLEKLPADNRLMSLKC